MARRTWDAGRGSSRRRTRPRVLVESSDVAVGWALGKALDRAGYEVAVCHGPSVHGAPCPLVQRGDCALAAGADVIVNRMWLTEPANRDVLRVLPTYVPSTPVIVEARLQERERHADVLAGCRVVPAPLITRGLLGVVHDKRTGKRGRWRAVQPLPAGSTTASHGGRIPGGSQATAGGSKAQDGSSASGSPVTA